MLHSNICPFLVIDLSAISFLLSLEPYGLRPCINDLQRCCRVKSGDLATQATGGSIPLCSEFGDL